MKSCDRCIHKKMCIARSSYDAVVESWNQQYPFVKMSKNGDVIAEQCSEYQTLSDIHLVPSKEPAGEPEPQIKRDHKYQFPP